MLLSDRDMRASFLSGKIGIFPYDPRLVQPSSLDVRLGEHFRVMLPGEDPVDPRSVTDHTEFVACPKGESFCLQPGMFVLGQTLERVQLPADVAAKIEGKSSLGRLGLLLHATAGFIDPGFAGTITLELSLTSPRPLLLYPGMAIGQMCFLRMTSPAQYPYGDDALTSKYQGQSGPTPSRYVT